MSSGGVTPDDRARWAVQATIERNAVEAFDGVRVERPALFAGHSPVREVSALSGVRAARHAMAVASGRVRYYAQAARGDGTSWQEIGEALGLTAAEGHDRALGEVAFELIAQGREPGMPATDHWSGRGPSVSWRCGSCSERVTDRGPYDSAPDNNEQGHAQGCARHCADIADYRAERGEQ